ncbi:hypothetical protein EI013_25935, partial [Escherichia coli]|nr:hypothetical protein [Escherichia coli]
MVPVLQVTPKFKVKVEVTDCTNCAVFVLFDRDIHVLIQKSCEDLLYESAVWGSEDAYPPLLNCLIGKKLLFKVENKVQPSKQFEDSYPVRKVCSDEDIVGMFDLVRSNLTPTKAVFAPAFPKMANEIIDLEAPS